MYHHMLGTLRNWEQSVHQDQHWYCVQGNLGQAAEHLWDFSSIMILSESAQMHTCILAHMHTLRHTHVNTHPHTHAHTHGYIHAHVCTHTHAHIHKHTSLHTSASDYSLCLFVFPVHISSYLHSPHNRSTM